MMEEYSSKQVMHYRLCFDLPARCTKCRCIHTYICAYSEPIFLTVCMLSCMPAMLFFKCEALGCGEDHR